MDTKLEWDELWARARAFRPHGEPPGWGFETRLRASLRADEPGLWEALAGLSFRFSCATLPLLVAAAAFLVFQYREGVPTGFDDLVLRWTELFPAVR